MNLSLPKKIMTDIVARALAEDLGGGDITTRAIARPHDAMRGGISAQGQGVIAGLPLVREVFRQINPKVKVEPVVADGTQVKSGDELLRLAGPAAAILTGERTALNFLGMLSGMATVTSRYVEAVAGTSTKIYDTRKTPPGLRLLSKYAVAAGGGTNHRIGLFDAVLIKDNHIGLAGNVTQAVTRMRAHDRKHLPVEVETETLAQVQEALAVKAEVILLDNMSFAQLREAVKLINHRAEIEVSGSVPLAEARSIAHLGVDRISVGALTHSAPWLPMHLEWE
ncbi:MAG: carboxylating nicotinate-nucleotide diphosphorylase [Candidatus Firestonebacteria bacterium]|nr:carboxylating nicotinate-nucleotide diphosphorylase [Candidatus Firestonebacteria bacterium]